jgi:hypothetical protein
LYASQGRARPQQRVNNQQAVNNEKEKFTQMYATKVHFANSGNQLVVEAGGQIVPGNGTEGGIQAAAISNPIDDASTTAAVVSILAALRALGIVAAS